MNHAAFLAFFSEGCVMPMVLIKVLEIANRSFIMAYSSRLDGSRGGMSQCEHELRVNPKVTGCIYMLRGLAATAEGAYT
jgi:hypothetical protein